MSIKDINNAITILRNYCKENYNDNAFDNCINCKLRDIRCKDPCFYHDYENKNIEQKEAILDKVTEECRKQMKEYEDSILEIFPQRILNIIEGENNGK